ncbi:MAG: conjugal transfer protein TraG N-terminal domain-containing protein, partial [Pseudomonas aeruginosa]
MWEVYAYQNADSLFGVFNAAAAVHGSSDYASAIAAVAFCGFIAALTAYAFAPEKLQGWKWLATVMLVFCVLIVPRVTVGVVDKTGGAPVKVVDNVPLGVAVLGSLTSTIGHTLTGLFETAFQTIPGAGELPAELSYQR